MTRSPAATHAPAVWQRCSVAPQSRAGRDRLRGGCGEGEGGCARRAAATGRTLRGQLLRPRRQLLRLLVRRSRQRAGEAGGGAVQRGPGGVLLLLLLRASVGAASRGLARCRSRSGSLRRGCRVRSRLRAGGT